jgi:serine/threonine protein kinase
MKPEQWQKINELYYAALEREASERAALLDEACAGDEELRREVESLLAANEQAGSFLISPAIDDAAKMVAEDQAKRRAAIEPSEQSTQAIKELTAGQAQADRKPFVLTPGVTLDGRYLIEKELGRGGIGVVFLARDQKLHATPVVIKVLLEKLQETEQRAWFEKKFKQEMKALARIDHPGVVRALDVGELPDGRSYLVMQYVSGVSLRSVIPSRGMELERVGKLMRQIGQALAAAHEQGVIHRDLKAGNIMLQQVGDEEYIKLIDFGIATVLETPTPTTIPTTRVAGTIEYMAPEQLQGNPSAASDIYALGVIAYEMVTGRLPFNPESPYQLLEMQRAGVRVKPCDLRPGLPAASQAVILKALSFAQQDRYTRAKDFGEALAHALTVEVEESSPPELELAHILFTDLVGYSELTIDKQTLLLERLQEVVSANASFRRAQANQQLIRIPTGDGMALVFFGDPLAPVKCAVEIARALKSHPEIKLRMGIHTGPVQRVADINQNVSISGGGINMAQRVMGCGEAGHILLSKTVADVLSQLSEWVGYLQDWGEQEVKQGVKVHVFNLYTGEAGNPEQLTKIRAITPPRQRAKRAPLVLLAALLVVVAIGAIVWWRIQSQSRGAADAPQAGVAAVAERTLSYSLTVQKDPKRYPGSKLEIQADEGPFKAGDAVRLNVVSPQAGYLYIINERPPQKTGWPNYIILFPYYTANDGLAEIVANQPIQIPVPRGEPEKDWFIFDKEKGVEKIWLVWSKRGVPELEAVKGLANPKDEGVIRDRNQIRSVAQYLAAQSATKPEIEKDEVNKQTKLKGKGEVLVWLVELEHH